MKLPAYTSHTKITVKTTQRVKDLTLNVTEFYDIGKGDCHYKASVRSDNNDRVVIKNFNSYEDASAYLSHYIF